LIEKQVLVLYGKKALYKIGSVGVNELEVCYPFKKSVHNGF
jgi:hypothetical protein